MGLPKKVRDALANIEPECPREIVRDGSSWCVCYKSGRIESRHHSRQAAMASRCAESLYASCLIGQQWGCRERRSRKSCDCTVRELPSCQLKNAGGCVKRRDNKNCHCRITPMPECLSPGCSDRRRGKLCDCPRCPGPPCKHILAGAVMALACARYLYEYVRCESGHIDEGWWHYLTDADHELYQPHLRLPSPRDLTNRQVRVDVLSYRQEHRQNLWHANDVLYADGCSPRHLARRIRQFISLSFTGGNRD